MVNHKYGEFSEEQIKSTKTRMQKQIFFLLLCVDEKTKEEHVNVNVNEAFINLLTWFGGLNEILSYPPELVRVISLLEEARQEFNSESFEFQKYRKLILDAGSEVMKIKEKT